MQGLELDFDDSHAYLLTRDFLHFYDSIIQSHGALREMHSSHNFCSPESQTCPNQKQSDHQVKGGDSAPPLCSHEISAQIV